MSDSNEYDPWDSLAEELGLEVKKAPPEAIAVPKEPPPVPEPKAPAPVAAVEPEPRVRPSRPMVAPEPIHDELSFGSEPANPPLAKPQLIEAPMDEPNLADSEGGIAEEAAPAAEEGGPRRRSRRGRRGSKGKAEPAAATEVAREETLAEVAASNVAEESSAETAGDDKSDEPGDEEETEVAGPGDRPKRRRRRRKKPGEREAAPSPAASEPAQKPVLAKQEADEPEAEKVAPARSAKHTVLDNDDDVDDLSDWTGPSWNELIASLYRPDR